MLRVAFTSEFRRGKLQDLVALLSGRNFETKQYEDEIAEEAFARLKNGVLNFINENHFKRLVMILRSAGFITSDLMGGQNAINFAYVLYLRGRDEDIPPADLERMVRRWFVMSLLTGRYSASPESAFDFDIRQIESNGCTRYTAPVLGAQLSEGFWATLLPQRMETSSSVSPFFLVFKAAQIKLHDMGFLSRDITVMDLVLNRSDIHHLFPRNFLKKQGLGPGVYNQIANYAVTQTEINIAIGDKPPSVYFDEVRNQCDGGAKKYGGITSMDDFKENLAQHCIPEGILGPLAGDYDAFLAERRKLMAAKIESYFNVL